jgi:hypothetical protein
VNINLIKYWQLHRCENKKGNIPLPNYLKPVLSSLRLLALAAIVVLPDIKKTKGMFMYFTWRDKYTVCNYKEEMFRLFKFNRSGWKE